MKPWRTTPNAMEDAVARQRHVVHHRRDRTGRSWRVPVFSGEHPIAVKLGEENKSKRAHAGQLVRAIDIPDDRKKGSGVFDEFDPGVDASSFAKEKA